ncbi:MAG: RNA polymerase sigma factor [Myxococcota bacterium]
MAAHLVVPMAPETPESWLARHAATGDQDAFEKLLRYFERPIRAYLSRCGLTGAEREDLTQEIFLRLHRGAGSYRPEKPAQVWVFTVVANCVRSHFRRVAVRTRTPAESVLPPPVGHPSAEEVHAAGEVAELLQNALQGLSLLQREVVLLHALQAMSISEIAEALSLPPGTVKTHLYRGRLNLAKALSRRDAQTQREQR